MFYLRKKGRCGIANNSELSAVSSVNSKAEDNRNVTGVTRDSVVVEQMNDGYEEIELVTIACKQDDVNLIETDVRRGSYGSMSYVDSNGNLVNEKPREICYDPERLITAQENRNSMQRDTPQIFPSIRPRVNGTSRLTTSDNSDVSRIEFPLTLPSKQSQREGTTQKCLDTLMDPLATTTSKESPLESQTLDPASSGLSYEKVNVNWKEHTKRICNPCQESLSDRSDVWNSNTLKQLQTPLCLGDELAIASTSFAVTTKSRTRLTAINEVVSILEGLETDPNRVAALLEEERFCKNNSSHDYLTRLALAIEPDGNVPAVLSEPLNLICQLRGKVESLQDANKDIQKDICTLMRDLQYDEKRVSLLTSETIKLRQDLNGMLYLDDLLKLLRGELERISHRNWPFIMSRTKHRTGEINLII